MKFYVGITDLSWFNFLSEQKPDEVNFWRPLGKDTFRALDPGEPFLFKLHSPQNFIVGGGFFSRFTQSPVRYAWEAFQQKNGTPSFGQLRDLLGRRRGLAGPVDPDEVIGCILLQQPFFFEQSDWIPASDWPAGIQRGKTYDTSTFEGQSLWQEVQARLVQSSPILDESVAIATQRHGRPQVVLPRLGQGAFRMIVVDAYQRQCAVSSSHVLHVLDAAHIKPYEVSGTHSPINGILLRKDIHTLFDLGYITVTPDYRIKVSKRIREEFDNGKEYYSMDGNPIRLPVVDQYRPSLELLDWHYHNRFKA